MALQADKIPQREVVSGKGDKSLMDGYQQVLVTDVLLISFGMRIVQQLLFVWRQHPYVEI